VAAAELTFLKSVGLAHRPPLYFPRGSDSFGAARTRKTGLQHDVRQKET